MDSSETPLNDGTSVETQSSHVQQSRQRGKTDPAWAYGLEMEVIDEGKKKKWIRCMYCDELFKGGGIHRLKLHLAGEKGDVKTCNKVSAEVRYEMQQSMANFAGMKRKADEDSARVRGGTGDSPEEVAAAARATRAKKGKFIAASNRPADRFFLSRGQPGDQKTIKSVLQSKEAVERVDLIINKWFLDASIPFNATTSRYYQPMIDAIASIGGGYKGPSMYRMRGPLLAKNVEATKKFAEGYRKAWKDSGCTIMADGWTDRKKRTLINFLVY